MSAILLVLALGSAEIGVKDRANANPAIAASGQFAAIVWGAKANDGPIDIFVAISRDGGRVFGAPVKASGAAAASLSGEQPPRVTLVPRAGKDPSIVVVWTAKGAAGTRLLSSRSDDSGKTFAAPVLVPGSDAAGNRGWESIASNRDGSTVALWLDHRETAAGMKPGAMDHAEHQHLAADQKPADGVARAQLSKLFFARLGDSASPRALLGGVCYCCKTAIATDTAGGVYAAWRHVYAGNVRDVAFIKSADGGRTFSAPVRVSNDNWVLDGCPENGPTLIVDDQKRVHIVWPTLLPGSAPSSEPALALFYAMSTDGRSFTARRQLPTDGVARHPQLAIGPGGEMIAAWDEQASNGRRVALARAAVDGGGNPKFIRQRVDDPQSAEYPVVASTTDGTIVAWASGTAGHTVLRIERR